MKELKNYLSPEQVQKYKLIRYGIEDDAQISLVDLLEYVPNYIGEFKFVLERNNDGHWSCIYRHPEVLNELVEFSRVHAIDAVFDTLLWAKENKRC